MLDLSDRPESRAPDEVARLIAARTGGELLVVSAVEPVLLYGLPAEYSNVAISIDKEAVQARENEIRARFSEEQVRQRARETVGAHNANWRSVVSIGQPAQEVSDVARNANASVIVVDASPRRPRGAIGRKAAQLLQHSATPVLSVAPNLFTLPRRAVAAVDFSAASTYAVRCAADILESGASLELVHVLEHVVPNIPIPALQGPELHRNLLDQLEQIAAALSAARGDLKITSRVLEGSVAEGILDAAESGDADLIVTGTQGRNALERLFIGSVAMDLLHSATMSVLVAPPPDAVGGTRRRRKSAAVGRSRSG